MECMEVIDWIKHASNFAEEWRFHISFTSQVKIQPLERTTEGPDLQWGHSTVC